MFPHMLEAASIDPAVANEDEQQNAMFAASAEELAGLRFSILLTAKWEASDTVTDERRAELRTELSNLRSLYLDQIDKFAMAFGVQSAIEAKEEIERSVELPDDMVTAMIPIEPEELYF